MRVFVLMWRQLEVMLPPYRCGSDVPSTKKWAKASREEAPMAQDKEHSMAIRITAFLLPKLVLSFPH
jgi:hypothetical protein